MILHNGETYQSNFQRAARLISSTCAPRPADSERALAWDFIKLAYRVFSEASKAVGLPVKPDTYFGRWEQQKGREQDVKSIRSAEDKIMSFVETLLAFVKVSEWEDDGLFADKDALKIPTLFFKVLDEMQVSYRKKDGTTLLIEKACAQALKELSKIAMVNSVDTEGRKRADCELVYFSRIVFEPETDWLTERFDRMMNAEGRLLSLCEELGKRGFYHKVYIDGRRLSMNYLLDCVENPGPLKMSFGERERLGIEVSLEDIHLDAAILSLRIPNYRAVLTDFEKYSQQTQQFMLEHTKTCDACRYCVKTDKTGLRPLAAFSLEGKKKCPMYPSFSYSFSEVSGDNEENILKLFEEILSIKSLKGMKSSARR